MYDDIDDTDHKLAEEAPAKANWELEQRVEKRTVELERANRELRLEAQLHDAQRLESLGVLAGGIAHDFNNLLVGILGNASLALMLLPPESPARAKIEQIELTARRAGELTKQMLAYSGKGRFSVQPLDLSHELEEMAPLLESVVSQKVRIEYHCLPDLPPAPSDATQIRQAIMNLIANASEAIGDRSGVITVATGVVDADRAYLSRFSLAEQLPEGVYVWLRVSDTGRGMDPAVQARMFEPFFSSKFTGRGLGLASVLGIVRGHQGAINVESEVGQGTTLTILLPAYKDSLDSRAREEVGGLRDGRPTILVADDEEVVRGVAAMMLERAGFAVITARDGDEAIRILHRHQYQIDGVLLDLRMPGKGGEEVLVELRRMRPDLPVILSSGYSSHVDGSPLAASGATAFVQKPYTTAQLLETVREALRS